MNPNIYLVLAILVISAITFLTRAIPFLLFGKRDLPAIITYLGNVLPPAIMIILVCYCLKGTDFSSFRALLPELLSCLAVAAVHVIKKNLYLSIIVGTVCYMILIRIL